MKFSKKYLWILAISTLVQLGMPESVVAETQQVELVRTADCADLEKYVGTLADAKVKVAAWKKSYDQVRQDDSDYGYACKDYKIFGGNQQQKAAIARVTTARNNLTSHLGELDKQTDQLTSTYRQMLPLLQKLKFRQECISEIRRNIDAVPAWGGGAKRDGIQTLANACK